MTIQSTIKEIGLFDLFQILHLHRKTGRLIVQAASGDKEAKVVFKEGAVCFASVYEGSPKSIEELFAEWGVLDVESFAKLSKKLKKYDNLIDAIDGEGITPRNHIENFLSNCVRETVFDELCRRAKVVPAQADSKEAALPSDLNVDRASLAEKLIRRRRAAGLSQAELARRAGIRPETLNRIERGKTNPDFATVRKLVVAMNAAELEAADL